LLVLDIGSGLGSLSEPWKKAGYQTLGIDIDINSEADIKTDFLSLRKWEYPRPNLILCNPPFNGYYPKLAGEVFFDQIIKLFGLEIPLVIFFPYSFRLGVRNHSQRLSKFLTKYPAISSIISLPLDVYEKVSFHSEILLFNISGLEPHYFFSFSTPNHYELKLKKV
jgi:type I restriction enzyme M protein